MVTTINITPVSGIGFAFEEGNNGDVMSATNVRDIMAAPAPQHGMRAAPKMGLNGPRAPQF